MEEHLVIAVLSDASVMKLQSHSRAGGQRDFDAVCVYARFAIWTCVDSNGQEQSINEFSAALAEQESYARDRLA